MTTALGTCASPCHSLHLGLSCGARVNATVARYREPSRITNAIGESETCRGPQF